MVRKDNDDSSSSEDEIYKDALKEAADNEFLKDSYFSNEKSSETRTLHLSNNSNTLPKVKAAENPKSLRRNEEQTEKFENFGVTESFQKFVAKKLDEIIEKNIRLKNNTDENLLADQNKKESVDKSGVKLLSSSIEFLTTSDESENLHVFKKRRKREDIEEDSKNIIKCKEVVVDPERILSKVETKAWTSKRREPEFKYKRLKNGVLIEQL